MEKCQVMISEAEIKSRVKQMAKSIDMDFGGEPITAICALKGAFVFAADLLREMQSPTHVEFIRLSSYGENTTPSEKLDVIDVGAIEVTGKNILVVEDIVDTGRTLSYLLKYLESREPKSLRLCALLSKPSRRVVEVDAHYIGFSIPDEFVVGYGLDYAQMYRNLPYIAKIISAIS